MVWVGRLVRLPPGDIAEQDRSPWLRASLPRDVNDLQEPLQDRLGDIGTQDPTWSAEMAELGSVANSGISEGELIVRLEVLCSNTEEGVDELTLADDIALAQPTNLSFSDCMHRLISLDGSRRAFGGPESEAGGDALLDESMVLFDHIIQVG